MSWRTIKLGDIVENFSVRAIEINNYSELVFCGVSNQDGITVSKYAAEDKIENYKVIEKGCFAYNPYRINVGSIALLNDNRKGLISPAYVIFKTKPKTIIDELLLKFLKSTEGLRQIKLHARGAVRQALRFEDLCKIELSIPDFEEQKILFGKLDVQQKSANILIVELNNQLALVKQLRQTYLREAMQGKLVRQDSTDEPAQVLLEKIKAEKEKLTNEKKLKKDKPLSPIKPENIPFELPSNWTWCRFGTVLNVKSSKRIFASDYRNHGIPFYRSMEIGLLGEGKKITTELFITDEKYNEIKLRFGAPKNGDILMACIGGSIGNTWVVDEREFYYKDGNLVLIESIPEIYTQYLLSYLKCSYFMDSAMERVSGSSYNALTIIKINNSLFPLPPLAEQERIVAMLEKLMGFCDELEANIRQGIAHADSLLQTALKEALEPK